MKIPTLPLSIDLKWFAGVLLVGSLVLWGVIMKAQRDKARLNLRELQVTLQEVTAAQREAMQRAQREVAEIDEDTAAQLRHVAATMPAGDDPEALRRWALGVRK